VMSTNGTWKCGIYGNLLKKRGFETIIPDYDFQNEKIHRMIYDPDFGIKANTENVTAEAKALLEEALQYFKSCQADAIILGCTELSKVLTSDRVNEMLIVDSTRVLASALISEVRQSYEFA
ncbi:MAG: aspartate/glutamate racemase family protein, partial [Bacteroidota bacterium]